MNPSYKDIPPFRIADELYFIGAEPVSVHVIDTGSGLILLDTGYPFMLPGILAHMEKLGLSIKNVRHILHSHGHYDHIGCTKQLAAISGAKTWIGAPDRDYVNGKRDLSFARELGHEPAPFFEPDYLLTDGDELRLGNITIRCLLTPGHTEGTLSFFFRIKDRGQSFLAGMHGGVGTNSMEKAFLEKHGLPLFLRDRFSEGLLRLGQIPVALTLGNHPDQNDTVLKAGRLPADTANPFVDPLEWPRFLSACADRLHNLLESEK